MKIVTIILPWTLIRPNIIQASTEASKCSFLANIFSPRDKRRFYYRDDLHVYVHSLHKPQKELNFALSPSAKKRRVHDSHL